MTTIQKRFAEVVHRLKVDHGVSQNEIAGVMGILPSQVTRLKKGTTNYPTAPQIAALHKYYKVSADWLINGVGNIFT